MGPQAYMAFLNLWKDVAVVLTDSGGVQEETTALGVPCITIRENTERSVTVANMILAGLARSEAVLQNTTNWGPIYRVDMEVVRGQRCAKVRTAWLCTAEAARLVTCFVVGDCDETT